MRVAAARGRVLDLGCGTGHSYDASWLRGRRSASTSRPARSPARSARPTSPTCARSRSTPGRFASVVAIQSIEHVPDPERMLAEVARVLRPGGRAIIVTPNRLTFGRPDEIIDPYHYIEYDCP